MTWKQFAEKHLVDNGMPEDLAKTVAAQAMAHKTFAFMNDRSSHAVEDYPTAIKASFIACLRKVVREWIEEHLPEAWFKEKFQD